MKITISEIKVNPGRRPVNLEGINELARSISEIGLLNPITIDQNIPSLLACTVWKPQSGWVGRRSSVMSAPLTLCKRSWPKLTKMLCVPNFP